MCEITNKFTFEQLDACDHRAREEINDFLAIAEGEPVEETATHPEMKENPMLNYVVLSRFFDFCPLSDLKNFRVVSTLWHDVSLSRWRKDMTVTINRTYDCFGELTCSRDEIRGLHWLNLEEVLPTANEVKPPFQRLEIEDCFFFERRLRLLRELSSFGTTDMDSCEIASFNRAALFDQCGHWLRKLVIHSVSTEGSELLRIVYEKLPNLVDLTLLDVKVLGQGVRSTHTESRTPQLKSMTIGRELPFEWTQVFTVFTQLESLHLKNLKSNCIQELVDTLRQGRVRNQLRSLTLTNIQRSDFRYGIPEEVIELLDLPQLSLKRLSIDLNRDKERTVLPRVIIRHGINLETLRLDRSRKKDVNWFAYDNFPFEVSLVCLTELVLLGAVVANFHFLEHTPSLKTLRLEISQLGEIFKGTCLGIMKGFRLEHLERFEMDLESCGGCCVLQREMKMIVECMPNVTRFQGILNNRSFRVLCENWEERILELDLGTSQLNEEGITGIVPKSVVLPNISHLKCLRKFYVDSEYLKGVFGFELKDLSIPQVGEFLKEVQRRIDQVEPDHYLRRRKCFGKIYGIWDEIMGGCGCKKCGNAKEVMSSNELVLAKDDVQKGTRMWKIGGKGAEMGSHTLPKSDKRRGIIRFFRRILKFRVKK